MDITITLEEVLDFLPVLRSIDKDRLEYAFHMATTEIEDPCNNKVDVVAFYMANYFVITGELSEADPSSNGVKTIKTGDEQITYKDDASGVSYDQRYATALSNCQAGLGSGICGNCFIA